MQLEQAFTLPYPPSVNSHMASIPYYDKAKKKLRVRQISTAKWRNYLLLASKEIVLQKRIRIDGDVMVSIDIYPPDRRRRDSDNIVKAVFDSLTKSGIIEDDWQIVKHSVERKKENLNCVKIIISPVENDACS